MFVGIGYSDNPESYAAGLEAADEALAAGKGRACDLILIFATSRHDAGALRRGVTSRAGPDVPIYGGGSVGAISNERFGYGGDQVGMAAIWLEGAACHAAVEDGLCRDEAGAGLRLGRQLAAKGLTAENSILLLYDAIVTGEPEPRMIRASHLLRGLEQGLGFTPLVNGAGLMGDFQSTETPLWTGQGLGQYQALALAFGEPLRVDSVILHACRPATGYYTVTKADGATILEINNSPALPFMEQLLGPGTLRHNYPYFLLFGINAGAKWQIFEEDHYSNHICFGVDEKRNGIIMCDDNMSEGTEFQVMYRNMKPDYIIPRVERLFSSLEGRRPVFALYLNCASRAAGFGGMEMEDAVIVQQCVNNRAPMLGMYSAVEISQVSGRSIGMNWTGVFCLFSVPQ